jgi:hypothetical protein
MFGIKRMREEIEKERNIIFYKYIFLKLKVETQLTNRFAR